jgi:molybdopterin molybdotransferase
MIPFELAQERIVAAARRTPTEIVGLSEASGRALAEAAIAQVSHPAAAIAAMDGWAVRAEDMAGLAPGTPVRLRRLGVAAAGAPFNGVVLPAGAVRIFTGAILPTGADTVVVQEDADEADGTVTIQDWGGAGRHVRHEGEDFTVGSVGLPAGCRLAARHVALLAAMNCPWVRVHRRPRVALIATGDELAMPGETLGPGGLFNSNGPGLAALATAAGATVAQLAIARDDEASLMQAMDGARGSDLIVLMGGASVGERDLVQATLTRRGLQLDFWKIAMRPGKPLLFGAWEGTPLLGLPGNPVSALLCGFLFMRPLLMAMQGLDPTLPRFQAVLGGPVPAGDGRADFLRARLERRPDGCLAAMPFRGQNSGMLRGLAQADALIVRPPMAPALPEGAGVEILALDVL